MRYSCRVRDGGKRRKSVHLGDTQEREAHVWSRERRKRKRALWDRRLAQRGGDRKRVEEDKHDKADAGPPVPDPAESQRGQSERLSRSD